MKTTLIIFAFFLFLISNSSAQNYNSEPLFKIKKIQTLYLDVGGMYLPLSTATVNFNLGFGYQANNFLGFGVSYNNASSWQGFNDKFNGFGLDYRIQHKHWWIKNTFGIITNYIPSQKSLFYQKFKNEKNKFFYRASVGWIPAGGIFKIGVAYHLTDAATYETWSCAPGLPECNFLSHEKRKVHNLQLYIGIHFPNPNRKSLDRMILKK